MDNKLEVLNNDKLGFIEEINKSMKFVSRALQKAGVNPVQQMLVYKEILKDAGIEVPEFISVEDVDISFNRELDLVKRFLEESCIIDKNSIVPSADLYNSFISWCEINEEESVSQTMFGRKLKELGIHKGRKSSMRFWKGIRL